MQEIEEQTPKARKEMRSVVSSAFVVRHNADVRKLEISMDKWERACIVQSMHALQ